MGELEELRSLLDGMPAGSWPGALPDELVRELARGEAGQEALERLQEWEEAFGPPEIGPGGSIRYRADGPGPVVVVRPAQLTLIRLGEGEVLRDLFLGDPARWTAEAALSGAGARAAPVLVVGAQAASLTTSLVAVTDRRSYRLQLVSSSVHHMPRIAFETPGAPAGPGLRADLEALRERLDRLEGRLRERIAAPPGPGAARLDFGYRLRGGERAPWRPRHVYNDGARTYIVMPEEMAVEHAPVFLLRDGRDLLPVNYRLVEGRFVIDRIFSEGALVSGTGRRRQEVRILRTFRPAP